MDSPFSGRLHTNYVPSAAEVASIKIDLVSHSSELERLDALIQDLTTQRSRVQSYIDSHSALISPARRLPRDIVEAIFLACLPSNRLPAMAASEAPLLLCHICSAWRAIALSSPRFWASLHIVLELVLRDPYGISLVSEWLQRSGTCPLSLTVFEQSNNFMHLVAGSPVPLIGTIPSAKRYPERLSTLLESLARTSDRWHNVDFHSLPTSAWARLLEIHAPKLEVLILQSPVPVPWNPFNSPRVRSVSLQIPELDKIELHIHMPLIWKQLTRLSLTGFSSPLSSFAVFIILKQCSRLTYFRTNVADSNDGTILSALDEPLSLPLLASLIFESGSKVPASLLHNICMPELRTFEMKRASYTASPPPNSTSLATLATRSPFLECLVLDFTLLPSDVVLDALRLLHHLTRLEVVAFSKSWTPPPAANHPSIDSEQLLSHLIGEICPKLQELVISRCPPVPDELLFAFIEGRTTTFRRFRVTFVEPPPMNALDLEPFRLRGMEITLKYNNGWILSTDGPTLSPWTGLDT
ncbi:hypothetical protein DFH06DRAFT_1198048 [Mycena polygramma]|nr:hypothetical protein DFH06DRAFT_1198048 [Mycena polygramma]